MSRNPSTVYCKQSLKAEKRPLVSVIIPAYNCAEFIDDCVSGVLNQTLPNIEVICVDDGSTDGTSSKLDVLATTDERLHVIHQPNRGEGAARNTGLVKARGEFLAFFDADDLVEPSLLEKMTSLAQKHAADIAICGVDSINQQTGERLPVPWGCERSNYPANPFSCQDNPDAIFRSFQNWTWNKLFRASFIEKCGLRFHEVQRSADLFFVMCALVMATRIVATEDALYHYRTSNPTSNIATSDRAPLDFALSFLEVKKYLLREGKFPLIERAYKNWAAGSVLFNLNIMRSPSSFEELRSYLQREGCVKLGLDAMAKDEYFNPEEHSQIQHLLHDNAQSFLFSQLRYANACAEREKESALRLAKQYDEAQRSVRKSSIQLAKSIARPVRNIYRSYQDLG